MTTYAVRILKAASRELERLDKSAGRRVFERIRWLAENADKAKPQDNESQRVVERFWAAMHAFS